MYRLPQIQLPSSMEAQESYFTIVGFALNGPVNVPFIISADSNPYEILGPCPMADAAIVAIEKGITPLLVRLNGAHAIAELELPTGAVIGTFTSIEAKTACNDINITVFPTYIRVTGVAKEERFYVYTDYPTLGQLRDAINADAKYGMGEITMEATDDLIPCTSFTDVAYDIYLKDGEDGEHLISQFDGSDTVELYDMQKTLLKDSLLEEYQESGVTLYDYTGELTPFNVDTIIIPDIPYENSPEVAEIMGRYCESKSTEQDAFCSCVLGSMYFDDIDSEDKPYSTMIDSLVAMGAASNETHFTHIEVVIGVEEETNRGVKMPVASKFAVSRYALPIDKEHEDMSKLHLSPLHVSATNKEISDIRTLFSRFRKEHIASLAGSGYTCIIPSIRRGYVAHKSLSFVADKNLITSKPHFSRASRYYANQVVGSLDSFIGESTNNIKLTAMEQLLKSKTEELKTQDIYKSVEYTLEVSGYNSVKVTLTFVIYGEVETIHTTASYDPIRKTVIEWT